MIHLDNYLLFLSPRSLPFSPPILSGEDLGDTGSGQGTDKDLSPTVSKETYYSVKRDLLQCQKRPTTVSKERGQTRT